MQGLCKNLDNTSIVKSLVHEIKQNCVVRDENKLKNSIIKSAAFIVLITIDSKFEIENNLCAKIEREILHEISSASCQLFTISIIQVCIECWSWIISTRPDIESLIVEEMLNAWQMTVDMRMGMFSEHINEPNPLAKEEHDVFQPNLPPNIDTHRFWIRYMQERLEIAKYKSDVEIELFFNLMNKTLAFNVTEDVHDSSLNRHVSCVGLRFRYLNMALTVIQSSSNFSITNSMAKWILRERIYFSGLDYFAQQNYRAPTQKNTDLRDDIKNMIEFWNKIVAEKKYLKEENFCLNFITAFEESLNKSNQVNIVVGTAGSGGTPVDAVSVSGVETGNGSNSNTGLNPTLGTSATYTANSGLPQIASDGPASYTATTGNGGAITHLIVSSGLFLEQSLAMNNITNSGYGGMPKAESIVFNNTNGSKNNISHQVSKNPNIWMNTLSKRNNGKLLN
jgi:hypothetical protein